MAARFGALLLVLVFHAPVPGVLDRRHRADPGRDVSDSRAVNRRCRSAMGLPSSCSAGLGPLIATWLVSVTGNPLAPAFYVMTGAAISAVAVLSMKET